MPPAYQRLKAGQFARGQIGLRLVVNLELVQAERSAQVTFDCATGTGTSVHIAIEHTDSAAPVLLRLIKCEIGGANQSAVVAPSRGPIAIPILAPIVAIWSSIR